MKLKGICILSTNFKFNLKNARKIPSPKIFFSRCLLFCGTHSRMANLFFLLINKIQIELHILTCNYRRTHGHKRHSSTKFNHDHRHLSSSHNRFPRNNLLPHKSSFLHEICILVMYFYKTKITTPVFLLILLFLFIYCATIPSLSPSPLPSSPLLPPFFFEWRE